MQLPIFIGPLSPELNANEVEETFKNAVPLEESPKEKITELITVLFRRIEFESLKIPVFLIMLTPLEFAI
jgi:hypothetical protein